MSDAAARHGPGRPGPPDADPLADPLAELVRRLRAAGLDPDAEQLRDALWLAGWARPADAADAPARRDGRPGPRPAPPRDRPPAPRPDDGARSAAPEEPPHAAPADRRVALYPVPRAGVSGGAGRARALPLGVPAAPVLPSPLELQRALRPLQGYRSPAPPRRTELDEVATAELSAQAGG
ncbi:hypothetical protein NGM37_43190, partial [Streptomyces sp. TRM76130]|nr:hypothetical protein [Streptomyces sp. TRM76130]